MECENENYKSDSPENAYISLNNYILSGMPCDRANSVTEKNEDDLQKKRAKKIVVKR